MFYKNIAELKGNKTGWQLEGKKSWASEVYFELTSSSSSSMSLHVTESFSRHGILSAKSWTISD